MLRAYKYRIYPSEVQKALLNKHFGACRFVYNLALETKNYAYVSNRTKVGYIDLINQLPDLKKECEWLREVDSQALQQSIINLDKAFTQFFKGAGNFPNFKKKTAKQSFRSPHPGKLNIDFTKGTINLPKFKSPLKVAYDRRFKGQVKSATFSKTPTGKYFVSILTETGENVPDKKPVVIEKSVGIDLGIKHFAVLSNGEKIDNHKHLKSSLQRLKCLQRRASRKKKGSSNRRKANRKVALLHEKIANQRKDFLHKLSGRLIKNHDTLCLEDLAVTCMVKNHNLAQSISDAGWSEFVEMLKYKADWNGNNILQIGRFEPSTKICSVCGTTNHALTLSDREWTCAKCNTSHDRDVNAAINIKIFSLSKSGWVTSVEPVELPTLVGAMKQEGVH